MINTKYQLVYTLFTHDVNSPNLTMKIDLPEYKFILNV